MMTIRRLGIIKVEHLPYRILTLFPFLILVSPDRQKSPFQFQWMEGRMMKKVENNFTSLLGPNLPDLF